MDIKPPRLPRTPPETLDLQMHLLRWWATQEGFRFARGFLRSVESVDYNHTPLALRPTEEQLEERAKGVTEMHREILANASTFHVTRNMMTLAEAAAEKMEPQVLREEILPVRRGFMYFERPFYLIDVRGMKCNIRAVSWYPAAPGALGSWQPGRLPTGIILSLYSSWEDVEDADSLTLVANYKEAYQQGKTLAPLVLFGSDPWEFGRDYNDIANFELYGNPDEDLREQIANMHSHVRNMLHAIWMLCQQKIVTMRSVTPDRRQAKQVKRAGLLMADADLRIITLRRRDDMPIQYNDDGTEKDVNWSHQWIVDGHWRWQRYTHGYADGHRCSHCGMTGVEHKQIYIEPHLKGPPDKPLIRKNTIFRVAR